MLTREHLAIAIFNKAFRPPWARPVAHALRGALPRIVIDDTQ
jgi:hypothetical protein